MGCGTRLNGMGSNILRGGRRVCFRYVRVVEAGAFDIILFIYFIYLSLAHVKMLRIAITTLFE
jgi:hypothetical protein